MWFSLLFSLLMYTKTFSVHIRGIWAQNFRQGIVLKTSFKAWVSQMGLGSFVNINIFVMKYYFFQFVYILIFFKSLKSKSTQMLTPQKKIGSVVQQYSFKFRALRLYCKLYSLYFSKYGNHRKSGVGTPLKRLWRIKQILRTIIIAIICIPPSTIYQTNMKQTESAKFAWDVHYSAVTSQLV